MLRRKFLQSLSVMAGSAAAFFSVPPASSSVFSSSSRRFLRPPGARAEEEFIGSCIGCGLCGEICPNRAIRYFGVSNGLSSMDTPYIIPREQACILCMKCGDVCPTGAITKISHKAPDIIAKVRMGKALVDKNLCYSYQGRTCGVCYWACPLPKVGMRLGMMEKPIVLDGCVGCGLCERTCIQMPQAIRIFPHRDRA